MLRDKQEHTVVQSIQKVSFKEFLFNQKCEEFISKFGETVTIGMYQFFKLKDTDIVFDFRKAGVDIFNQF